jgi:hypothetical protein
MNERIIPNGKCWCGCGGDTQLGKFFLSGHDRAAETMVIKMKWGGVVGFLAEFGYVPGGKNPTLEYNKYLEQQNRKNK